MKEVGYINEWTKCGGEWTRPSVELTKESGKYGLIREYGAKKGH
jgi:hypothetical protein